MFGRDWKADAERRDFTINSLSVTVDGTVHDFVGGLPDIAARHVRFIGEPRQRTKKMISAHLALLQVSRPFRRGSAGRGWLACLHRRAVRPRRAFPRAGADGASKTSRRGARDADAGGDDGVRAARHGARRRRLPRRLDLDHLLEAREGGHAAKHHAEQPALRHHHQRRRRARRDEKFRSSIRTRSRESVSRPDARRCRHEASGVGRSLAEMGVNRRSARCADSLLRSAVAARR